MQNNDKTLKSIDGSEKSSYGFIAGGWIRDKYLNLESDDLDFVLSSGTSDRIFVNFNNAMTKFSKQTGSPFEFKLINTTCLQSPTVRGQLLH